MQDLIQHVQGPMQRSGHTLDLLLTRVTEVMVSNVQVSDSRLSDHRAIICCLHLSKPLANRKQVSLHKFRWVNMDNLRRDLLMCDGVHNLSGDVDAAAEQCDTALWTVLDVHAPMRTRTVVVNPDPVCFNNHVHEVRRTRGKLERKWHKTILQVDYQIYCSQCQAVTRQYMLLRQTTTSLKSSGMQRTPSCCLRWLMTSSTDLVSLHCWLATRHWPWLIGSRISSRRR